MHPIDNDIKITKKAWIPLTTVYGGIDGVKLFIKHRIIETVYAWEDSFNEIISISLNRLYINTQKQHETHFKDIKMYGTLFNYNGFGLDAIKGEIENACVPEYLYNLYNNPDETNPRKRLSKLTMDKILKELNMNTIDEGCSITQIANFCNIHKITYYVLNYKYKLFETNNNVGHNSNLQRLVFMCANNHLYPIDDDEKRLTIFRTCAMVGGGMKKYKAQQAFEHKVIETSKQRIHMHYEDMSFYALLEKARQAREEDTYGHRIIITTRGLCNSIFYSEIQRGNIHNGKVKIAKGGQIMGFDMYGITIDENEHYSDIQMTMDTLNTHITNDAEKYVYNGQSLHGLAYAYYTNNYDRKITSNCSPQVYDILTSKSCMNSPFL
jgi:hypothetical protein